MRYLLPALTASVLFSTPAWGELRINEFMQSNIDLLLDDLNDFPDSWVELYNSSSEPAQLAEYSLGISNKPSKIWQLPEMTVEPYGFVVVYCDKAESGLHTSFRLESGKGGEIYLFRNGEIVEHLTDIKKMPAPGISFGRFSEDEDESGYQAIPTPGAPNCRRILKDILGEPIFSEESRVSHIPFQINLTLTVPEDSPEGTEIRYTLDGSEPTAESPLYTAPLSITGNVVRARLFHQDYLSPRSSARSYILTDHELSLPVVSIVAPDEYFYDDGIGILVDGTYHPTRPNSYYDWRRPVNVEYFPTLGSTSVLNQLAETRVKGGASRIYDLKSMVIYANKRFGTKRLEYEFFPEDAPGLTDWKSIEMRNAGNDHGYLYCRDGIIQTIFGRNTSIDFQPFQPAILMINGRYAGPLNLRSRSNEDHIYTFYDGLEDIDMIENWVELKAGDWDNFNAFMEFFAEEGHSFEEYSQWMDVEEFADIMIMNSFFDNRDFPGNNIVWWRPQSEDGRWRIIAKDTDYGLGLKKYVSDYPTLSWLVNPEFGDDSEKHAPYTLLFRHLLETPEFKELFITRAKNYLEGFLASESIIARIMEVTERLKPELLHYRSTVDQWWMDYEEEQENTIRWVRERVPFFLTHLDNFLDPEYLGVGDIEESGKGSVSVYDISGRLAGIFASRADFMNTQVPSGVYILRQGDDTVKITR
ncbi:MAG: hypothetical protein HDS26_04780 [Bacteroides sp.]|nr:hypothetical protein [Bacteroides sp.]